MMQLNGKITNLPENFPYFQGNGELTIIENHEFKIYLGSTLLGDLEHIPLQTKNANKFRKYESWGHFCSVLFNYLNIMITAKKDFPQGKYRVDIDQDVLNMMDMDSFKLDNEYPSTMLSIEHYVRYAREP